MLGFQGGSGATLTTISQSALTGWYQAQAATAAARASGPQLSGVSTGAREPEDTVTPPWEAEAKPKPAADLARAALASGDFLDAKNLEGFSDAETSADNKQLFALHQGVKKLWAIASEAADKTTTDLRRGFLERRFQEGMTQLNDFMSAVSFDKAAVFLGEARERAESTLGIPRGKAEYTTPVLHDGPFDDPVAAFQGDTSFTITVRKNGVDTPIAVDFADIAGDRTLDAVAAHLNTALENAGMVTQVKRVKVGEPNEDGVVEGERFALKFEGVDTEALSFSAPDAGPALYVVGASGGVEAAGPEAGQFTKLTDLDAAGPTAAPSRRVEVKGAEDLDHEDGGLRFVATKAAGDGSVFALAQAEGDPQDGPGLRGERDVLLIKYDSTGRQVWTRALGATNDAEGLSLAVSATGEVAVGGSVSGAFDETLDTGGKDAFVAKYSADGEETFLRRFGSASDEAVEALSFDAAGNLYAAGATQAALGGQSHGGGRDGFVRAFDAVGGTVWTHQTGAAGDESVAAIAIADDGQVLIAKEAESGARLEKLDAATGAPDGSWAFDLGDLDSGSIAGLAVEGANIYVAGSARDGMNGAGAVTAHTGGGRDAFVVKIADGATPTESYRTFLGSTSEDMAVDLTVSGGEVYLAGRTDGDLQGGGALSGERNAFAAKLATDGGLAWTQTITGRGGKSEAAGIAFDPTGASALDRLGLPAGELHYADSALVADRTSARAGDSFTMLIGSRKRTITLEDDDTLRGLSFKITNELLLAGEASVSRRSTGDLLRITPNEGVSIELVPGPEGRDLLKALGISPGTVEKPAAADPDDESSLPKKFALKLADGFSLLTQDDAEAAKKALDAAMSTVRRAYRDVNRDPALDAALEQAAQASGPAPAYLTAKIASYQAALQRLGG